LLDEAFAKPLHICIFRAPSKGIGQLERYVYTLKFKYIKYVADGAWGWGCYNSITQMFIDADFKLF
jgi:hypothetical protein